MHFRFNYIVILTGVVAFMGCHALKTPSQLSQPGISVVPYDSLVSNDSVMLIDKQLVRSEFEGKDSLGLEHIRIGGQCSTVPEWAFAKLSTLRNVALMGAVRKIADNAFFSCKNLSEINLECISVVGESAFKATALSHVFLPKVSSVGEFAFANCKNLHTVVLSDSLRHVGDFAFSGDVALDSVFCGGDSALTVEFGQAAFAECTSLRFISLPAGLETIPSLTFLNCSALETIVIPSSVKVVEKGAFDGCTGLKHVVFQKHGTMYFKEEFSTTVSIEYINK